MYKVIQQRIGIPIDHSLIHCAITTILDINYADFLQFQRYLIPQAELEEAFIYIIHKPIDFSIYFWYRLRSYGHWLETSNSIKWQPTTQSLYSKSFIVTLRASISNISTFDKFFYLLLIFTHDDLFST